MMLRRESREQKEMGIQLALGAGRGRLVRQLLMESLALSLAGGVLGVALSGWIVAVVQASVADADRFTLPRIQEAGIGGVVLLFSFAISAATGVLFGLLPALRVSRPDLHG